MSTDTAPLLRPHGPSLRPALIVLAVAVVIVGAGAALALVGTSSARAKASQLGTNVPGVPFKAVAAAPDLSHVVSDDEPPSDVVKSLTVPADSHFVASADDDAQAGQFDRSITFSVPETPKSVDTFYTKELRGARWSVQFDGSANGDLELIGQRNGSDGYQWRVAVVITTVNPTLSPSLAGSNDTSTSSVVMTVYQVEDAS